MQKNNPPTHKQTNKKLLISSSDRKKKFVSWRKEKLNRTLEFFFKWQQKWKTERIENKIEVIPQNTKHKKQRDGKGEKRELR